MSITHLKCEVFILINAAYLRYTYFFIIIINDDTMKNSSFKFASETIHPGESLTLALPLPQLFSCAPLYMPIKLIHGREQGPTLLLIAALYGNELNGTEIIQRLLSIPALSKLKGTLIAVPVMNVHGLINRSRFLPEGVDLNRNFPGHVHGTNAERFANIFVNEILSRAEYCVNLQSGPLNYYHSPMIQCYTQNIETLDLAKRFHAPIIVHARTETGSLQEVALQQQKIFLNYIAGEALRFDAAAIRTGIYGVLNIMRKLGMLPEKNKIEKKIGPVVADELKSISANASGTHHTPIKVGEEIQADDLLSIIKDPFGNNDNIELKSPFTGIVVGKNNNPLIHEGDILFDVAIFSNGRPDHD